MLVAIAIAIAIADAFDLGVLSSSVHTAWALAQGGTLEDRPRYNKTRCFETFPFPGDDTGLTAELRQRIADRAEAIDAHRKRVLARHPDALTLTGLYNVLDALRAGRALSAKKERAIADILANSTHALPLPALEARFKGRGPWEKSLPRILETLEALGRARREEHGWRG
ncbi:MAG: type IIL restriction-modification enzyme MmeI [Thiomonas sp.]